MIRNMSTCLDIFEQFSLESSYYNASALILWVSLTIWIGIFSAVIFQLIFDRGIIMLEPKEYHSVWNYIKSPDGKDLFIRAHIIFFILLYVPSYTTFNAAIIITLGVVYGLYFTQSVSSSLLSNKVANSGFLVSYIKDLIEKTIGIRAGLYIYLILETGLCLGLLNIIGIIPFSCSTTSQFILPFTLSLSFFIFNNIIGSLIHRFEIFNLFMPKGVPLFITPLLLIIENISYFARIFSLSIRLCANMLAVHILLKILISFTSILLFITLWGHYLLTLLISILVLDCSTCFLQSYIFIFLSLIYLSNVLIMH